MILNIDILIDHHITFYNYFDDMRATVDEITFRNKILKIYKAKFQ